MIQVSQHVKSGAILIEEVPMPAMKPGHLLVQTPYSVIGPGTEHASVSSRPLSFLSKVKESPLSIESLVMRTSIFFKVQENLRKGMPVSL